MFSKKHVIDCNKSPFTPSGWQVEEHKEGGELEWPAKVRLHLSDKQKIDWIEGNKLYEELKKQKLLNTNVLDYLLKNPSQIPKEWKEKYVFFWGTIYRDSDGDRVVRCLCWLGGEWDWLYDWLGFDFHGYDPAAVLAS